MSDRRTLIATYEDTSFAVGDSLVVLPIQTDLGHPATRGYIACDGAGNITVELSTGASGVYTDSVTMKTGEVFDLDGLLVTAIRFTHTGTDSAYRVAVA